ncbi:MAG: ArsC/Spx/MgsR family protein [Cyanobacteria bacterium P01_A01_bin.135]
MAIVDFFEKPGCVGNAKQKRVLQTAGHTLQLHNLLAEPWTPERLRPFFGDRPVVEWFNPTALAIKSGEVCPEELSADQALALMIAQPILIRRPLMQVGDRRQFGFNLKAVDAWIGLAPESDLSEDLQRCPQA